MGIKKTVEFNNYMNRTITTYLDYDSGEIDGTTTEATVTLSQQIVQLLVYPTVESSIKLDDSTKSIYLPANVWTPISVVCDSFKIKTLSEDNKIYWQGWVL